MRLIALAALPALARRPDLWPQAVRTAAATIPPGWWRRWPPRPLPPAGYRRFRHETMWGHDPDARIDGAQLVDYLSWCARIRKAAR